MRTAFVAGLLAFGGRPALAQDGAPSGPSWEILVPTGRLIPTGDQRDDVQRGGLTALQISRAVRPRFALTTTLGWARSHDAAAPERSKLDVFLLDLGTELRAPRLVRGRGAFGAFVGAGAGVRAYNHRELDVFTRNVAAYGSAGGEVGFRRAHLRIEGRNYVTGFQDFARLEGAVARNDVVVMVGLRFGSR